MAFLYDPAAIWLLAGAGFVILEAFVAPGVGLLFLGIGAILAGLSVGLGLVASQALVAQTTIFLIGTAGSAALLWKRIRQYVQARRGYAHMVGDTGVVMNKPLTHDAEGTIRWSGTTLAARLAEEGKVAEGKEVEIISISGNVALCKPITKKG